MTVTTARDTLTDAPEAGDPARVRVWLDELAAQVSETTMTNPGPPKCEGRATDPDSQGEDNDDQGDDDDDS